MGIIKPVNEVDGNQYLVKDASNASNSSDVSFDEVFNSQTKTLEDIFRQASEEYGVPLRLLKAVAQAESDFDTNAVSHCGAAGIMQLMPETAKSLGVEDVFDAQQNITGGAKMLAYLLVDYDNNTTLALAAYNAGSGAVAKYNGVPPYEETLNYIKKINGILEGELEADTTNISITKNPPAIAGSSKESPVIRSAVVNPVIRKDADTLASELFSYEIYLKFLELYEKLTSTMFDNHYKENKETVKNVQQQNISEQQSHYELNKAMLNTKARSLMDLE